MSIPASQIVQVNPGVISGGGNALNLNGVILTENTAVPIGTAMPFVTADAVSSFFGATSVEASLAAIYFGGRNNKTLTPGQLFFWQYNASAVAAYLRSGSLAAMTLAQLQALSGTIIVTVNGTQYTSSSISLSSATSFSNAATLIQAGFTSPGFSVSYDSQRSAFVITSDFTGAGASFTGAISGTTLTVSAVTSGTIAVGQTLSGTGITAGTTITALGTGTGGTGTYTISQTQTVSSEAMTTNGSTIGFASGTLAASIYLTQSTGAVTSQGAAATTPSASMTALTQATLNWGGFMNAFAPVDADKISFAQWNSQQNNRFLYALWDTNAAAKTYPDTSTALSTIITDNYGGVFPVYCDATADPNGLAAAFVLGTMASIDFSRKNGRITFAFKYLDGVPTSVTDATTAADLKLNGYNFIGQYATANQGFTFFYPGSITGAYDFADEYVNQVYLNSQLQLALMTLLTQVNSIPYNADGYALIRAACLDPITQALNFGSIRAGVSLSALQASEVNNAAGLAIDQTLSTRGWYLQILDATAQVRASRGSPPMTLWYMDGGSVQQINLASIVVQ